MIGMRKVHDVLQLILGVLGILLFAGLFVILGYAIGVVTSGAEPAAADKGYEQMTAKVMTLNETKPASAEPEIKYVECVVTNSKPEKEEPKESTDEELLQSGYLSDDIPFTYDLQKAARNAAKEYNVPYALVIAIINQESSFKTDAYNCNCYGLMQVSSINFEWLRERIGVTDVANDPEDNIRAGTYIISDLVQKYGDYHKALMAYNCGPTGAANLWSQGYYMSNYSIDVMNYMNELLDKGIAQEDVSDGTVSKYVWMDN